MPLLRTCIRNSYDLLGTLLLGHMQGPAAAATTRASIFSSQMALQPTATTQQMRIPQHPHSWRSEDWHNVTYKQLPYIYRTGAEACFKQESGSIMRTGPSISSHFRFWGFVRTVRGTGLVDIALTPYYRRPSELQVLGFFPRQGMYAAGSDGQPAAGWLMEANTFVSLS